MRIEEKITHLLVKSSKTVSLAESCTGGLLTHKMTNIPGSSKCLKGAVIAYDNEAKKRLLKVPARIITTYGAVSTETALAMADGARKVFQSDFGVGITGIAGPAGGSRLKPVGLVYIAVSTKNESLCLHCRFTGDRGKIKTQSAKQALKLLLEFLK